MTKKKRSLRNEKLKANRASESEEQRKGRLRIEDPGHSQRLKRGEVEEKLLVNNSSYFTLTHVISLITPHAHAVM